MESVISEVKYCFKRNKCIYEENTVQYNNYSEITDLSNSLKELSAQFEIDLWHEDS